MKVYLSCTRASLSSLPVQLDRDPQMLVALDHHEAHIFSTMLGLLFRFMELK